MREKTGVFILGLILLSILWGCTSSFSSDDGHQPDEKQVVNQDEYLSNDLNEIVYMYPWYGTIPSGVTDVEEALNEITIEKIHTRVYLKPVPAATFSQQLSLSLAGNEDVDLVLIPEDFLEFKMQNQLLDMTELIQLRGQGILDAVGPFIDGTKQDDRIYGVTVMSGKATSPHFLLRHDWLEETGVDIGQIVPVNDILYMDKNLQVIEDIFEKVKEKHPQAQILVSTLGVLHLEYLITYDTMGDELGVIINGDNDKIVNLYDTEEFRKIVLLAQRWYSKGYLMQDAAMNTASSGTILLAGNSFADLVITQQGVEAQYKQTTGFDFTAIQMACPLLYTGQNLQVVNALPVTCNNPEAAIDFLNLLYTDKEVVNLMAYGVEGKHYQFMPNGTVDYPEGITAQSSAYPCIQTWSFGNSLLDYVKVGNIPNLYELQAENNNTAKRSVAFGFLYDNTSVRSEVLACLKVVKEYKDGLLTGALDIEKLDEFNERLEEAGINKIIEEKQRQFDLWKAAQ